VGIFTFTRSRGAHFGWRGTLAGLSLIVFIDACGDGTDVFLAHVSPPVADGGRDDTGATFAADATGQDALEEAADAASCAAESPDGSTTGSLLSQLVGFGRETTGGLGGCVYHVTSLDDSGPGTLRDAAGRPDPAWIVFDISGDLLLASDVPVSSNKTIDGRGAQVVVHDYGLFISGPTSNVIVDNLAFTSSLTSSDNNAITLSGGASNVWVDHCSFSGYGDGHLHFAGGPTDITISWCSFSNNPHVMLVGTNAMDTATADTRVTLHHNWWNQIGNYAPRLRFGRVHAFNNLFDRWVSNAVVVTMSGQVYSEANAFLSASHTAGIVLEYSDDPDPGFAVSVGDLLENGTTVETSGPGTVFTPGDAYSYSIDPPDVVVSDVPVTAGPQ
jgi:pectate lyase